VAARASPGATAGALLASASSPLTPGGEGAVDGAGGAGEGEPRGSVGPPGSGTAGGPVRIGDGPADRWVCASPSRNDTGSPNVRTAVIPKSTNAALVKAIFRFSSLMSAPLGAETRESLITGVVAGGCHAAPGGSDRRGRRQSDSVAPGPGSRFGTARSAHGLAAASIRLLGCSGCSHPRNAGAPRGTLPTTVARSASVSSLCGRGEYRGDA
jgi:hypothetical protein